MALKNFFPRGTENGACESRRSEYTPITQERIELTCKLESKDAIHMYML